MKEPVLLALGDSITDGGSKVRSYRYHLHQMLVHAGHRVRWAGSMTGVYDLQRGRNATSGRLVRGAAAADWPAEAQVHEGHWGWTAQQLLSGHRRQPHRLSLAGWLSEMRRSSRLPDAVLLHVGTNDLTKLVFKEGASISSVARRTQSIVHRLCRASPRVGLLLAAPIPYCRFRVGDASQQGAHRASRRAAEAELGDRLRAICTGGAAAPSACARARVVCVNMSSALRCEHLVADGVHPSAAGATRMAAQWFRALEPLLGPR